MTDYEALAADVRSLAAKMQLPVLSAEFDDTVSIDADELATPQAILQAAKTGGAGFITLEVARFAHEALLALEAEHYGGKREVPSHIVTAIRGARAHDGESYSVSVQWAASGMAFAVDWVDAWFVRLFNLVMAARGDRGD